MENKPSNEEIIKYRICLAGDAQVGKTLLFSKISRINKENKIIKIPGIEKIPGFDEIPGIEEIPEIEEIVRKEDESCLEIKLKISMNIYEKSRSFKISLFDNELLNSADGIIYIYDILNKKTFETLKIDLETIKKSEKHDKCLFMVIGNKNDQSYGRKVDLDEVDDYCKNNNLIWGGEMSFHKDHVTVFINIIKDFIKEIYKKNL